jgi:hypothetical protein
MIPRRSEAAGRPFKRREVLDFSMTVLMLGVCGMSETRTEKNVSTEA